MGLNESGAPPVGREGHPLTPATRSSGGAQADSAAAQPEASADGRQFQQSIPTVTLPTGGGAIRGIDEKITVNLATGSATFSVPIATTPCRHDFGPSLTLSYDSGSGNGPFGLGWRLSPASISRKTAKGLPQYADSVESDVFVLSDAEDLVPALVAAGDTWAADTATAPGYAINRYRPRVESAFSRVERWTDVATGDVHWRCISRDNVTSLFGSTQASRVADPADPTRIFSWLIDLMFDGFGNAVSYEYKPEDTANVPAHASEASRSAATNQYLKRIRYAPTTPYDPASPPEAWSFEVVLDYGEHDLTTPTPTEEASWSSRVDACSSYRSGFEVRTRRLCRRILMFHTFDELGPDPVLVGSTNLGYATDVSTDSRVPVYSLLTSVTRVGYLATADGYQIRSMPSVELDYSRLTINDTIIEPDRETLGNLPRGVDETNWQWADLDGEGLQGVLTSDDGAWYYHRNVSGYQPNGGPLTLSLEPQSVVLTKPAGTSASSRLALADLHGDGRLDAVDFGPPMPGYHERQNDGSWSPFTTFAATAALDFTDANTRRLDLDGDGLADVLVTSDDAFTWYAWQAADGYQPGGRVVVPRDEEVGPALVLAAPDQSIFVADMSGDGLSDLVRVRNGEICYWPNLGYGRFGAKVLMDAPPTFDNADVFAARRVRLADVDGSGTADILYLGSEGARLWFNQSGNGFADPVELPTLDGFDDTSTVSTVDLLGSGTTCLVWSSPLPGSATPPLRYVDLLGGSKPHLLTSVVNNLGAETLLEYASSTRFSLQDRLAGHPWATRLAFPVQVVTRKETNDVVSGARFVATYAYHHGFFDGVEREFRGFAMVEQSDADFVPAGSGTGSFTALPATEGGEFVLPPVRTSTWFHTGAFVGGTDLAAVLATEYYAGDAEARQLDGTWFPEGLAVEDLREACRALRGKVLRQETYADDGSAARQDPFAVSQHRYRVTRLQPASGESYGSFMTSDLETLTYHYERNPSDPRTAHTMTLEIDDFGTVLKQAEVCYPRRASTFDQQLVLLATYIEHDVTHVTGQPDWYRIAVPVESRHFELGGVQPPAGGVLLDPATFVAVAAGAPAIPDDQALSGAVVQKRLFARQCTRYRSDDLTTVLAVGDVQPLALIDRAYRLAMTPGGATDRYAGKATLLDATQLAEADGGYVDLDSDGCWWAASNQLLYSPDPAAPDAGFAAAHFYLPQGQVDPFGGVSTLGWANDLVPVTSTDPVGNTSTAQPNYRVLRPWLLTDMNGNRTGVRFDELGMVVAHAVMGKAVGLADEGDHLDLSSSEAAPGDDPTETLDYDLDGFRTWAADPTHDPSRPVPASAHTRSRVRHRDPATPWIERYAYSDGFGRLVLTKAQAEPGPAPERDASGALVRGAGGALVFAESPTRWIGSGRIVRDNKGNPVKSYEPFFDSAPVYEAESDLVEWGVTGVSRFDPMNRVIRVDKPDGTYRSTEFDAWQQIVSDENDTVLDSAWYAARKDGGRGASQQAAASKAAAHAGTPQVSDLDVLGRVFRTVEDGPTGSMVTVHTLDIQGRNTAVLDPLGRTAVSTDYDLLGNPIRTSSIDSGEQWSLLTSDAKPLRQWDGRGQQIDVSYDAGRRPVATALTIGASGPLTCSTVVYGEGVANDAANNLRGAVYEQRDDAGVVRTNRRDFQGNIASSTRQLVADPSVDVDWAHPPVLAGDPLSSRMTFDALNRVVTATAPDGSVTTPTFNERSLLVSITVESAGTTTSYVDSVEYDNRAQRLSIEYGNGAITTYTYEPATFRLSTLVTSRPSSGSPVQDLSYTYDPVGNVTRVADAAQSTIFFANQLVAPVGDYTYDATYRVTAAAGREHIGQTTSWDDSSRRAVPLPTDAQAMRNYTEAYAYDLIGNLTSITHTAVGGSWTRAFHYDEPNPAPTNDRLTSTSVGTTVEAYTYDANGNIASMPHLSSMSWDFRNQLRSTASQVVVAGGVQTTWYRYDADKNRAVKARTGSDGGMLSERVYLGSFERYREYAPDANISLERLTLRISDGARHLVLVETTTADTSQHGPMPPPTTRYQLGDRVDSACVELDQHAAVISYEEYFPFGSTSFQAGRSQAEVSLKRYRYTGKERDEETGFSYHGARYYAAWLGRWTSCDPAGLVAGTGVYTYVRNNPLHLSDPAGTDPVDPAEPIPPPAQVTSGYGITQRVEGQPATTGLFYSGSGTGTLAGANAFGVSGGGGVVVGLSRLAQLQLAATPILAGQATTPNISGILFSGQLQLNVPHGPLIEGEHVGDPRAQNNFFVISGNFGVQSPTSGGPQTLVGGGSAVWGHEWELRYPGNDFSHPRWQIDTNIGLGGAANAGGLTPGSNFTGLGTLLASASFTYIPRYQLDAPKLGGGSTTSSLAPWTVGGELYGSVSGGSLSAADGSGAPQTRAGVTTTIGANFLGSAISRRLDSGTGPGSNRIGIAWAVGPLVTIDSSGAGGPAVVGVGARAVFTVWFGSGTPPTNTRDTGSH